MYNFEEDIAGALAQYEFALSLVGRHVTPLRPLKLTPDLICLLHGVAFAGSERVEAGKLRTMNVMLVPSDHQPTAPERVHEELANFCDYVNGRWETASAEHLAAYVLWKLNWIHPFADGNGRTARTLSYAVLSIKLGGVLPGAPTIPEQLLYHRAEYFDALRAADVSFARDGLADLHKLERMIVEMAREQILGLPAVSPAVRAHLEEIVEMRIRRAPLRLVQQIFGEAAITQRAWAIGDHLVLQIGSSSNVEEAETRHLNMGNAFPRLFAVGRSVALQHIHKDQIGLVIEKPIYRVSNGYALDLEQNAAIIVQEPSLEWTATSSGSGGQWRTRSTLYVSRYGGEMTPYRAADVFDFLVARHVVNRAA